MGHLGDAFFTIGPWVASRVKYSVECAGPQDLQNPFAPRCLPSRSTPNRLNLPMPSKRLRADLALGLCALIWGATFVVIKDALSDVSVVVYLAIRFGLAAIVMAVIYWRSLRELTPRTVWAGAQIGFFMFGGYIFQIAGLKFTTPSKAAFITGSCVVMVPIFLVAFGRRRITPWIWGGALAALAGLYFLTVPPEGLGALNRGDPLVLACAAMFALHMIFIG